ncbi:DUF2946 family protein [Dyella sp. C9]|uniref:DUF2946 family protein n=1 Tax=Dyella sp. C9 TaxID=2202154 RepID=UPI0013009944|nr:DUF2946 family protein [Dyella sp. C9]
MPKVLVGIGMHRTGTRRNVVAWLALWAACLLLFAPSISRLAMAANMDATMADMCGEHAQADEHSPAAHPGTDAMDACAYCALVSHGTVLGGTIVFTVPVLPGAPAIAPESGRRAAATAPRRRLARAPPPLTQSPRANA